jgi:Tol biopolymer transport system component
MPETAQVRARPARLAALVLAAALPGCGRLRDGPSPSPSSGSHCGNYAHRVTTIKPQGARVDWSHANGLIAYDRTGANGPYFDVYVMAPDGSQDTCLTCGKPGIPHKNNGNPAWHPSGDYIVFQSEAAGSRVLPFSSDPGRGVNNVLWVTDRAGQQFTQITELNTADPASGVLHPHFSADGSRLSWSELYEGTDILAGTFFGHWRLAVADFVVAGGRPGLRNIRKFEPSTPAFYENHGFSPDGSHLIISSNVAQPSGLQALNNDIFLFDLNTLGLTRLTDSNYNEHAEYFPDGRKIVWMTNRDVPNRGTDLWIMNPDGSGKERLTFLNQAGCPEYAGARAVAADHSVNAAGDKIVVNVQDQIFGSGSNIMLVELDRSF